MLENIFQAASHAVLREVWEYAARRWGGEFCKCGCNRKCPTVGQIISSVRHHESHLCAVFRGSSSSHTTEGASKAEQNESSHDYSLQRLLKCNTQVLVEKPNTSPCLYVQLGVVVAAAYWAKKTGNPWFAAQTRTMLQSRLLGFDSAGTCKPLKCMIE